MKLKSKILKILGGVAAAFILNMGLVSSVGADSYVMKVVSSFGDPVLTDFTGPFYPATHAYLAGLQKPRDDGGYNPYVRIEGAKWIWRGDFIGDMYKPLFFPKTFSIPNGATEIVGIMEIAADDYFNFSINEVNYGITSSPYDSRLERNQIHTYPITSLAAGDNDLLVSAWEFNPGTPSGLIYKLTIAYNLQIEATVEIKPGTINLKSHDVFTASIRLPPEYNVRQIDLKTIQCEGALALSGNVIGDTIAVKFNGEDLRGVVLGEEVAFTVAGKFYEGKSFSGTDLVKVISPAKK